MKLYLAYGANTNTANMSVRCPDARYVGNITLRGYRLVFRGVADLSKAKGEKVTCAMWLISPKDELALDGFEGFPNLYIKHYVTVRLRGKSHSVMFYAMRTRRYEAPPSERYEATLREGYTQCGMSTKQIDRAISHAKAWQAVHGVPAQVRHGKWATPAPVDVFDPEVEGFEDADAAAQFLLDFYANNHGK